MSLYTDWLGDDRKDGSAQGLDPAN
jgi:hypothetical protein